VLGSTLISAVSAGPDYLGYFNFFAGGRAGGHEISIYGEDWGQDRQRLAELASERKLTPLYYDPQTPMRAQEARFVGLVYKPLRCGMNISDAWVALHALTYKTRDVDKCYPYLKGRKRDLDVNQHIYLWHLPPSPKAADIPPVAKPEDVRPESRPDAPPEEN
jgi:hypothetical protein